MYSIYKMPYPEYKNDNKLVPNPNDPDNWKKIAGIISAVLSEGTKESHKTVYKKALEVAGQIVEVTYTKIDGITRISDAWVK